MHNDGAHMEFMHHHRTFGERRNGARPATLYLMSATNRFVVVGNPVAHSLSPVIHARFGAQCGVALSYEKLLAPLDDFAATARTFFAGGGRGANVTLPFKVEALALAHAASERAKLAGAANMLTARDGRIEADNADGEGLVGDLTRNLGLALRGARIAILGAGGATRGVVGPLLAQAPERLVIANRTFDRARELVARFAALGPVHAAALDRIEGAPFDLVINATSTSTHGERLDLPAGLLAPGALVYDMVYGAPARAFLDRVEARGARVSDGLGMLVEQAAEAFRVWHGMRPVTAAVLAELRARP